MRQGARQGADRWRSAAVCAPQSQTDDCAVTPTSYDIDLDRSPANFQPLTPLTFLERAAAVFSDHTAIIHGPLRRSYAEFYARARRLASALAKRGIKRGDTRSEEHRSELQSLRPIVCRFLL